MQRVTASEHWHLFKGYLVIFGAAVLVAFVLVGAAVSLDVIAEAVR